MWSSRHFPGGRRDGKAPEISNFAQTCNLLSQYIKEKGSLRDLNLEIGGKVESLEALGKPGSSLSSPASTTVSLLTNTGKSHQPSSEKQPSRTDPHIIMGEDASNKAITSKDGTTRDSKTAQLTIFYSGRVLVFDDYPAEKIQELVSVARKSSYQMSYGIMSNAIQKKTNPVASTSCGCDWLPPRPQAAGGKQPVGISSIACKETINISTSKAQEQLSPQSEADGSDLPIARRSSLHRFLEKRKDRAAVRGPYQNQEPPAPLSKGDEQQFDLNIFPQKD